jgi:putative FmdB family regulatory protein
MPIYEYRCSDCNRITNVFVRSVSSTLPEVKCDHCGSMRIERAISKFGIGKTVKSVIEEYGDPSLDDGSEYRDPRQIGRWAERKFEEYGMEMPEEARDIIDAAREGQFPKPLDDV